MNRLKLPVLAAVALMIAGCQTAKQLAHDGQASIFRPELWLKDDGLYYTAGVDEPYTGKHEAWYVNGDKAWEGEMNKRQAPWSIHPMVPGEWWPTRCRTLSGWQPRWDVGPVVSKRPG